jgi:dehydratase
MKPTFRRVGVRMIGIAALALLPLLGTALTADAATQTVTYAIQSSAIGQTANSTLSVDVTTAAPATVSPGGALTITLTPGPITVPSSASGYTITQINSIKLLVPVPANSTYVSASLSGGSNLGSGTPSVSESGGVVTASVPGPIAGGATFTLPALTLGLTAGSSGTITTQLAGTSYSNPGLTFTAVVSVFGFPVNAATAGYPNPNPVLATTTIG